MSLDVDYVNFSVEETFAESLGLLFDRPQIAVTKAPKEHWLHESTGVVLGIPQVHDAANWRLQADAVWGASIYLAEHLEVCLEGSFEGETLELGSGAGLLGIAIAKRYPEARVTLSDYGDSGIISTLKQNVARNQLAGTASVQPLDWNDISGLNGKTYDRIVAADTLWNSQLHKAFCQTLQVGLRPKAKAHLLAGLHTGRYTLQHFIDTANDMGFKIDNLLEYRLSGSETREWKVEREGESSEDMIHWLLYIRLSLQ